MSFEMKVGSRRQAVGRTATPPFLASSLQPLASPRSGMTLVELLVVIVLVTTLVTTAIPIISPGGDNKKIREASRNLNAYLQGAQARAIETGRPFGVAFQRLSADTERGADNAVCVRAEYVEVPPHYSGVDGSSLARVCVNHLNQLSLQLVRYGDAASPNNDGLPPGYDVDLAPDAFIRPGDHVDVGGENFVILPYLESTPVFAPGVVYTPTYNATGPAGGYFQTSLQTQSQQVFRIEPVGPETPTTPLKHAILGPGNQRNVVEVTPTLTIPANLQSNFSYYFASAPAPFKLIRQPVPAGGEPLETPAGVAIDLQASVFTNGVRVFKPSDAGGNVLTDPIMVLFSPEGNIDRVYYGANSNGLLVSSSVTSTLALCVGRRDLIPPKELTGGTIDDPINLYDHVVQPGLSETDAKDVMDQYNWMNLDSRWVLVGGQSGSVSTIASSAVYPSATTATTLQQIGAAIDNAPSRTRLGGR